MHAAAAPATGAGAEGARAAAAAACAHTDLDDDDINAAYVPSKSTASRKLAAVARLPRGAAAICVLTFGITLVGGLVLTSLFSATSTARRGAVAQNRAASSSDWQKTARVARHIDKQVDTVQNMEDELSLFNDMQAGQGGRRSGERRSRRRAGGGGSDMPFLDPVQPMQQYDQFKQDYRQQQRARAKPRASSGLTAAMHSYIEEASSFIDPSGGQN
jgi:hypothetical protein